MNLKLLKLFSRKAVPSASINTSAVSEHTLSVGRGVDWINGNVLGQQATSENFTQRLCTTCIDKTVYWRETEGLYVPSGYDNFSYVALTDLSFHVLYDFS